MKKIKMFYRGERQADGWGNRPVMFRWEALKGKITQAEADREFARMLADCGEFASELVRVGQEDYTHVNF